VHILGVILLLGSLLGIAGTPVPVSGATLPPAVHDLATPGTQRAALETLLRQPVPELQGVLLALKEGALYIWQGQLLIFGNDGTLRQLDGQPLLDQKGAPLLPDSGLEPVALAEVNISLVQQILDVLDLVAADPERRKATVLRLGNRQEVTLVPVLENALRQETHPAVKAILTETINKLRLFDADPQVRQQAVTYFGATRAEAALSRLRDLQRQEQDAQVQAALTQAIGAIEQFLYKRNAVAYLFNGLSLASILLIMSMGLAITFGLMGIINMAHGEMLMLGSYTAYVLQELFATHLPGLREWYFIIALPLSVVVVGSVGLLMERGILRFLYGRPLESLLITWGIGMVLQQGARLYFGDQTSVSSPTWLRGGWEIIPGLILPYSRMFIIALALLCLGAVYGLLYYSNVGLKIRSVMQHRDMAACMGISARQVDAYTFALGTALAGLAGCALSLIGTVDPEVGKTYIVDSFLVVVLGGVGKLFGTVLAALGIGMSNKFLEPAIGGTAAAVYAKVSILVLVIFFLQLKPTGLFPAKERTAAGAVR
jgi:urea transport system permease protein